MYPYCSQRVPYIVRLSLPFKERGVVAKASNCTITGCGRRCGWYGTAIFSGKRRRGCVNKLLPLSNTTVGTGCNLQIYLKGNVVGGREQSTMIDICLYSDR